MGVTQPTVAKIIQRLKSLGLVQNRRYRALFLTDAGKALATRSRERHQVVVDFLVALGIDPEIAAIDSEGMEHHVSDATLQAMRGVVMGSSAQDKA
jgi:DtxR family manganese transport transcriptional regulator